MLKFRWVQDIFIEQLKVMFDFSNKLVTLFKQSKCFIETILWFYDSTCFSLFYYSSAVNYISYKCERQKNSPKIISDKYNTVKTWQKLFHSIFSSCSKASISYVLNMVPLPAAFLQLKMHFNCSGWWKHRRLSPWNCGCWSNSCRYIKVWEIFPSEDAFHTSHLPAKITWLQRTC